MLQLESNCISGLWHLAGLGEVSAKLGNAGPDKKMEVQGPKFNHSDDSLTFVIVYVRLLMFQGSSINLIWAPLNWKCTFLGGPKRKQPNKLLYPSKSLNHNMTNKSWVSIEPQLKLAARAMQPHWAEMPPQVSVDCHVEESPRCLKKWLKSWD